MTTRGAPKGNQNANKGRETHFHVGTSFALKGAASAAAEPGKLASLVNDAVREYLQAHHPDIVRRFPDAFK